MTRPRTFAVAAAVLVLAACSDNKPTPAASSSPTPTATGPQVDVNVVEFALVPSVSTVPHGAVTITMHNAGTIPHELVLMLTDNPKDKLPLEAGKSMVVEDGQGNKDVGEVEDVGPGTTKTGTFTLAAGRYVLLCNIVGHYAGGMRAAFTVT